MTPLILFTGLPGSGVTTRTAALRPALAQDNGFRGYEVDSDGKPVVGFRKANEAEFLSQMLNRREDLAGGMAEARRWAHPTSPFYLRIEVGSQQNSVEIWERSLPDAVRAVEELDGIDGIVISLPIHAERDSAVESQLDSLIRPLRKRHWIKSKQYKIPWIVFDLTQYEMLFCQIVPEMLVVPNALASLTVTPLSFAARRDIQEIAVRTFCQRWLGDNELTLLANAERQRCSVSYPDRPTERRRVMVQVSSAWGFLSGDVGPSARQPANCRHPGETGGALPSPRFPRFTSEETRSLTAPQTGAPANHIGQDSAKDVEQAAERFYKVWKPIGIVDPIPSVIWKKPAPNMFWAPQVMSEASSLG